MTDVSGTADMHTAAGTAGWAPLVRAGLRSDLLADAWDRLEAEALAPVGVVAAPSLSSVWRWKRCRRHIPCTGSARDTLGGALQEAIGAGERRIGLQDLVPAFTVRPPTGSGDPKLWPGRVSSSDPGTPRFDQLRRAS